ncbi:MAG: hypothetical protein M1501_01085 [Candidatus Omnitrophica bacterium]|nr:hypothetical protein [Candidatus Omnitrophota bacterium]
MKNKLELHQLQFLRFKIKSWQCIFFLSLFFLPALLHANVQTVSVTATNIVDTNQGILPNSSPTPVLQLAVTCTSDTGLSSANLTQVALTLYMTSTGNPPPPATGFIQRVSIYGDSTINPGTGTFDGSNIELGYLTVSGDGNDTPVTINLSSGLTDTNPPPGTDTIWTGTFFVVIQTSNTITNGSTVSVAYNSATVSGRTYYQPFGPSFSPVVNSPSGNSTCEAKITDLTPLATDVYPATLTPLTGNAYPGGDSINNPLPQFSSVPPNGYEPNGYDSTHYYTYGPITLMRASGQYYPDASYFNGQFGVWNKETEPEVMGMDIAYPVIGLNLAGEARTTQYGKTDYITQILVTIDSFPNNDGSVFDPTRDLADNINATYPNVSLWYDTAHTGIFDPTKDQMITPSNPIVLGGTPNIPIAPVGGYPNEWTATLQFTPPSAPLDSTVNNYGSGLDNYFIVICPKPDWSGTTQTPIYGTKFKLSLKTKPTKSLSFYSDTFPYNWKPNPPTLHPGDAVYADSVLFKAVNTVLDVEPFPQESLNKNLIDGRDEPPEAGGFPTPIFSINMDDGTGVAKDALQQVRVWFYSDDGSFTPNKLATLTTGANSGVSLWMDSKTSGNVGVFDPRNVSEANLEQGLSVIDETSGDSHITLSTSSLEWYNSDGTVWSPQNDDPANPLPKDKRYYVVLKPAVAIPMNNNDFFDNNTGTARGYDLFVCVRGRGISSSTYSTNPYERGIDFDNHIKAAIGLTHNNPDALPGDTVHIDTGVNNGIPSWDMQFHTGPYANTFGSPKLSFNWPIINNNLAGADVPCFFTNLTQPGQTVNSYQQTAVVGLDLVAPQGQDISFDQFSFLIIDDPLHPTFDYSKFVNVNGNPNDPNGGTGIALYKSNPSMPGIFSTAVDTRVLFSSTNPADAVELASSPTDPPNWHRIILHLDPNSVGNIPTTDTGSNAGPDYFLVIKPTSYMQPGDNFRILVWGSLQEDAGIDTGIDRTFHFIDNNPLDPTYLKSLTDSATGYSLSTTFKRVLTYELTDSSVSTPIFTDATISGEKVDAQSTWVPAIGINVYDASGVNKLNSFQVYFNPESDNVTPESDLMPLQTNNQSGITLWEDTTGSGVFNPSADTFLPSTVSLWQDDYTYSWLGLTPPVGPPGTVLGPTMPHDLIAKDTNLTFFQSTDHVYWYDADGNSVWFSGGTSQDALWIDSDGDGTYKQGTDELLAGTAPLNGTYGILVTGSLYGFAYYDNTYNGGAFVPGDDVYFIGRGRNKLGYYTDITLATPNTLPTSNISGNPDYWIAFKTGTSINYRDQFSFSLPSNDINFSSGYSSANTNLTTNTLTANIPVYLTDLSQPETYISAGSTLPVIGIRTYINDTTSNDTRITQLNVYLNGTNLFGPGGSGANLAALSTNSLTSGVALYENTTGETSWQSTDTACTPLSAILTTIGPGQYQVQFNFATNNPNTILPNVNTGINNFFIVLRANNPITGSPGNSVQAVILSSASTPSGSSISFGDSAGVGDAGTTDEYLTNTKTYYFSFPPISTLTVSKGVFTLSATDPNQGLTVAHLYWIYHYSDGTQSPINIFNGSSTTFQLPTQTNPSGLGIKSIEYWADDTGGDVEIPHNLYNLSSGDTTPPVTTISVSKGPSYQSGSTLYVTSSVNKNPTYFKITSVDPPDSVTGVSSGIASGYPKYNLDTDNPTTIYSTPFTVGVADTSIWAYAEDGAGNTESPHKQLTFTIDNTPPSAPTISLSPGAPTGNNGWYKAPAPTATITPGADTGAGTQGAAYSLDDGTTWNTSLSPNPVQISIKEGTNINIESYDFDYLGNGSFTTTYSGNPIKVDVTPPVTVINVNYPNNTFTLSATDNLSGVATTSYSFDNLRWNTYTPGNNVSIPPNTTTIYAMSVDDAGNTETPVETLINTNMSISGTILNYYGTPQTNVKILLSDDSTNETQMTQTDSTGAYQFNNLSQAGMYKIIPLVQNSVPLFKTYNGLQASQINQNFILIDGWSRIDYDLGNSRYYPFTSTQSVLSGAFLVDRYSFGNSAPQMLTSDINGNGVLDLLMTNGNNLYAYKYNSSTQSYANEQWSPISTSFSLSLADSATLDSNIQVFLSGTGANVADIYNSQGKAINPVVTDASAPSGTQWQTRVAAGVMFFAGSNGTTGFDTMYVTDFAPADTIVWETQLNRQIAPSKIVFDVRSDGKIEALAGGYFDTGNCQLTAVDVQTGQTLWTTTFSGVHGKITPYVSDIYGTGFDEIVAVRTSTASSPGPLIVYLINPANGQILNTWQSASYTPLTNQNISAAIADMTGGGIRDFVFTDDSGNLYGIDVRNGTNVITPSQNIGTLWAICRFAGTSGGNDLIISSGDTIKVLDNNLASVYSYTFTAAPQNVIVSDLDNDGIIDIIASLSDGTTHVLSPLTSADLPSNPTNLSAAVGSNNAVYLVWNYPSNGAALKGFEVYRTTTPANPSSYVLVGTTTSGQTLFTDTPSAGTYTYEVYAYNDYGSSPSINPATYQVYVPSTSSGGGGGGGGTPVGPLAIELSIILVLLKRRRVNG